MNPFEVYPWDPVSVKPSRILDLMRSHRSDTLLVRFFYEGYVYDAGVSQKTGSPVFFLNEDCYTSMLSFSMSACVEEVLLCDFTDQVSVLCVNEQDPSAFFPEA